MELIDKTILYNEVSRLEDLALNRVLDTLTSNPAYARYSAQLTERTALKHMIADSITVEATPVQHGFWKWFYEKNGNPLTGYDYDWGFRCSECGMALPDDFDNPDEPPKIHFCFNCGAKMDGR